MRDCHRRILRSPAITISQHRPGVILSGTDLGLHEAGGASAYQQYVRFIEKTSPSVVALEDDHSLETFASGYWDYLQAPLQVRCIINEAPEFMLILCTSAVDG